MLHSFFFQKFGRVQTLHTCVKTIKDVTDTFVVHFTLTCLWPRISHSYFLELLSRIKHWNL